MNHKDIVLTAKELNVKAGSNLKTVAIKSDDLKKLIQDLTPTLTKFDFSLLSPPALNTLDALDCQMPEDKPEAKKTKTKKKADVIPIKKDEPKERSIYQQGPAMIAAATDLIDVLNYDKDDIKKFEKLGLVEMVKELQNMADVINEPYEEKGETIQPDDKPDDFKTETISVFEANDITVKWGDEVVEDKGAATAISDKAMPTKEKKEVKKEKPVDKKEDKPKKEKKEKAPKEKKYTRINSFCDTLREKKALTKTEIEDGMNKLYGGEPKKQDGTIKFMLTPLVEFGLVTVEGTGKETTYQLK